ncbi:MAG: aldose epimerase family protein [Bacteroidota bacterium]
MKKITLLLSFVILPAIFDLSCKAQVESNVIAQKKSFGRLSDGNEAYLYTLKNKNGTEVDISNYGAVIVKIIVPDKDGTYKDVVLGYDSVQDYEKCKSYFGAVVGRYGNRIKKGTFKLDGKEYQLTINDGENHLHGGKKGINKRLWTVTEFDTISNGQKITLKYFSADGEEGYPGNVELNVTYTLTKNNELIIYYSATTDQNTILNPTNHTYFNLTGDPTKTILEHELMIDANQFTPVDDKLIPLGNLMDVTNTPFNFSTPKKIGKDIETNDEQLKFGKGYDHNWVLNKHQDKIFKCASLYDSSSGRFMEIYTDQPGLQFYSGNFLDGSITGKKGIKYRHRTGLCLETQRFPDSPNNPQFPTVRLNAGEIYTHTAVYKFSVK